MYLYLFYRFKLIFGMLIPCVWGDFEFKGGGLLVSGETSEKLTLLYLKLLSSINYERYINPDAPGRIQFVWYLDATKSLIY